MRHFGDRPVKEGISSTIGTDGTKWLWWMKRF